MTCKCAKRIARLERDVRRLRAQLPKEIHHATRHEVAVALREHEDRSLLHELPLHALGSDSYAEGT